MLTITDIETALARLSGFAVGTPGNRERSALFAALLVGPTYGALEEFTGYDHRTLIGVIDEIVNSGGLFNGGVDPHWLRRRVAGCGALVNDMLAAWAAREAHAAERGEGEFIDAKPLSPADGLHDGAVTEPTTDTEEVMKAQAKDTSPPPENCKCGKPFKHIGACKGWNRHVARAASAQPEKAVEVSRPKIKLRTPVAPLAVAAAEPRRAQLRVTLRAFDLEYEAEGFFLGLRCENATPEINRAAAELLKACGADVRQLFEAA